MTVWCVQKSRAIPVWRTIFHLCRDPKVFITFIVSAMILLCVMYYFQKLERHSKWDWNRILFDAFKGMLGFPLTFNSARLTIRVNIAFLSFGAIIFSTVLSTILSMFVMVPILNSQVKAVQEIIDGNFDLVGDRFTLALLSQWDEVRKNI